MDADYDNVCLKDQDCAVDFNDNDEVTTTSTSHKSSSHLAPFQVHLSSPDFPETAIKKFSRLVVSDVSGTINPNTFA